MNPAKTNAATLVTNQGGRGAERDNKTLTCDGDAFNAPELVACFSTPVRVGLELGATRLFQRLAAPPICVSQRTSLVVLSVPPRDFLAAARAGEFASSKVGRLVIARTEDVLAWIDLHRVTPRTPVDEGAELDAALAAVGARRVGART